VINRFIMPAMATALFLVPGVVFAVEGKDPQPKTGSAVMLNTRCPMDGMVVDAKAGTVPVTIGEGAEAKHYTMGFCTQACYTTFVKDPAPVMNGKFAPGPKSNFK
jgi:YHS domain-containing protein